MALLTCVNLSAGYAGRAAAAEVSFSIDRGCYMAIVGGNGSGKSTLLKCLAGVLKPLSGELLLGGGLKQGDFGALFQQREVRRDFPASVWEIVLSGRVGRLGLRPFYSPADRRAAKNNLERMGIFDLRRRTFRELSGGQQQRVLIARALCAAKCGLLLDEPTAGLDAEASAQLYALLRELNGREAMTIVMVTHDAELGIADADRVLAMRNGRQAFFGTAADYRVFANGRPTDDD